MKIQIQTNNLSQKLSFITHAVSAKSQLPVLQNILLETMEDKLILKGTDLEIGIETYCPAEILEQGGVTVPIRQFGELINSLPAETIILETKEGALMVVTKKTKSVFQTISKDEFPKLYDEKGELVARLKTEQIRKDVASIAFAASVDTTKPALSGILIKQEESGFLLVATDGYRLSLKRHNAASLSSASERVDVAMIIPARIFRELTAIKENTEDISMYVAKSNSQVIFELGETIVVGRLIEATYPNYEKIIPLDFSVQVGFDREELLKAVKICSIFARDSANIVKLTIEKDKITVSSSTSSVGENTVSIEAILKGEPNEIAFNAKYLLDILGNIDAERMVFAMTGPLNPGVFKKENDESFLHLIMPIRVQA